MMVICKFHFLQHEWVYANCEIDLESMQITTDTNISFFCSIESLTRHLHFKASLVKSKQECSSKPIRHAY